MGREIERKFLVSDLSVIAGVPGDPIVQGYLSIDPDRTVRVRLAGERAFLTVKGRSVGTARPEFEYAIPADDARRMLDTLCARPLVEKHRHLIEAHGHHWEVDVFEGGNAGLVVAEVEVEREDEHVDLPGWVGAEVTDDPRYLNANLVSRPYATW